MAGNDVTGGKLRVWKWKSGRHDIKQRKVLDGEDSCNLETG